MAVQFKSPTDKLKRITGFAWTEPGSLVLVSSIQGVTGFLYITEDGEEFTNSGRGEPGADETRTVTVSKITYHAEQEAFYATVFAFSNTVPDLPQVGSIIRSDDGGETWETVYESFVPYVGATWIAYDDENDRLRATIYRDAVQPAEPPGFFARHLQSADGDHWSIEGESFLATGEPPPAALREFMFAETITCELTEPLNPAQHYTAYARLSLVPIVGPEIESRPTTIQISRNRQTWTSVDTGLVGGLFTGVASLAAAEDGGVLIACGTAGIAATTNGTTWSRVVTIPTDPSLHITGCGFVDGQFLAIGTSTDDEFAPGIYNSRLWRSVNGFDWDSEILHSALGTGQPTGGSQMSSPFTAK